MKDTVRNVVNVTGRSKFSVLFSMLFTILFDLCVREAKNYAAVSSSVRIRLPKA